MAVTRILTAVLTLIIVPSLTAGASPRDDGPQDFGPGLVAFGPQTPPFDAQEEINRSTEEGGTEAFPLVRFRWPHVMTDWWAVSNYVDLGALGTILDYECQAVSYDGHNGNDIIIRDFYAQKEGYFVLAAADGVVIETADGNQDESTIGCEGPANFVILQHLDGTYSYYWHLRKWSVLVTPGDGVYEGQPLGMIGSSGCSTDSHLHFEVQNAGVWESFAGPCRAGASLWKNQQGHVSGNAPEAFYTGISLVQPDATSIKYRPPDMTHIVQTGGTVTHWFWARLLNIAPGDVSTVRYKQPDGTTYVEWTLNHTIFYSYSWWFWGTNLPTSGDTGTWTVEFRINGVLQESKSFVYNAVPYQSPLAVGRTVNVARGIARETLVGSDPDGDVLDFVIASQPANGEVALTGPRNRLFVYSPESEFSGNDSFHFRTQDAQGNLSLPATMTMNVSPVVANALRLERAVDYISVPADSSLNLASTFTLEAWIRRDEGSGGWQAIIDRRHPTFFNNFGYHLYVRFDGRIRLGVGTGLSAFYAVSSSQIPLREWTHVAATWDGSFLRVYIDGVEDGVPTAFTGPISYSGVSETRIGNAFIAGEGFRGEIEEVRIWNVARGATALQTGATCAFAEAPLPASVVGAWRFQGNANDDSASANHGIRVGGASFSWVSSAFDLSDCAVQDLDGDLVPDGSDNCPLVANIPQTNTDGDAFGDACDLCPLVVQREQVDSDHDGVGDACDVCPFFGDTDQTDTDSDGSGDLCDSQPSNASVGMPPGGITLNVTHDQGTGNTTFSWGAEPLSATYMTIRGTREQIEDRFYGTCQNTRDPNTADTVFVEDQSPPIGEAFFFVVIGVSTDGKRGLAGLDSDGRQRDFRAKDCL